MTITESVLIVNKDGLCGAPRQRSVGKAVRAVVHVLGVSSPHPLSRNALRAAVRQRREDILAAYRETWGTASHSIAYGRNLVLLAVRADGPIGIDVEPDISKPRAHIAETFFTPDEQTLLRRCADVREKEQVFRRLWVLKEAALKCVGGTVPANLADVWAETSLPDGSEGVVSLGWSADFIGSGYQPRTGLLFAPRDGHIASVVF